MANLRVAGADARRRPEDYVSNRNISNIFEEVPVLDKLIFVVPTKLRITSYELRIASSASLTARHLKRLRRKPQGTFKLYFVLCTLYLQIPIYGAEGGLLPKYC